MSVSKYDNTTAAHLPHIKHQPYLDLILYRASLIEIQGDTNSADFANVLQEFVYGATQSVSEAVQQIQAEYEVVITPEVHEFYLVSFAGRILDYAKEHLPGFELELPSTSKLIEQALVEGRAVDPLTTFEDAQLHTLYFNPGLQTLNTIRGVRIFYEDAMRG